MTEVREGKTILNTPVIDEDIRRLRAGDVIYLSGVMATGRDEVHRRVVTEGIDFPADLHDGVLFHAGPIVKENRYKNDGLKEDRLKDDCGYASQYEVISIGPTTSMRMEQYEYDFVRETGVRILIGKGGMKEKTELACREFGAVHCAAPAGCAVVGAVCVEEVIGAEWMDLGMPEAVWIMKVREFGPLVVTIDSDGNNYFEDKKKEYRRRKDEQISRILSELKL